VKVIALSELGQGALPVEIRVGALPADARSRAQLRGELARWGREVRIDDNRLHLIVDDDKVLPDLARWLVGQGLDLYGLIPQHASLEELFLQIVGTDGGL